MAYTPTTWVNDVTPVNATNMNNIEDGIEEALLPTRLENYETTGSSIVATGGKLTLDGIDDYATLPASVGQLTDGSKPFELVVNFNLDAIPTTSIISKKDTNWTTNNTAKGWEIRAIPYLILGLNYANGASSTGIAGSTTLIANTDYWVKLTFDGTTIDLLLSTDGINYTSEGTSTNVNDVTALTISENVEVQLGRGWWGFTGFTYYQNGDIKLITVNKDNTNTNKYIFDNTGTNTAILDTIGTDDGSSFNGATQAAINGIAFTLTQGITSYADNDRYLFEADEDSDTETGTPTLDIDSLGAKTIKGSLPIVAGNYYEGVYDSSDDTVNVVNAPPSISVSNLVAEVDLTGSSVTISDLDINADGGYYEIQIFNTGMTTNGQIYMFANGDATQTNYYRRGIVSTSASGNDATILYASTIASNGRIYMQYSERLTADSTYQYGTTTTPSTQQLQWFKSGGTTTNVTSITLSTSVGLFTGGTAKIYKRS